MMRFARVVSFVVIGLAGLAARGQAQTAGAAADTSRFYAAFNFGATFGHQSSGFLGGEAGVRVTGPYSIFFEAGQMKNVGTDDLDARALKIANAVGATASTSYRVNYFDFGVRYAPPMTWMAKPYLAAGFGGADVNSSTTLAVNGTAVPPESLGVQFGNDLNGSSTKAFLMIGGGVTYPFAERYFLDGSYRYGHIFPKSGDIEGDTAINTQRLELQVGIRF
jgi:hypothetical protein